MDSGGIVLRVVVDDVFDDALEDGDAVADEVVVGLFAKVFVFNAVGQGSIAVEDAAGCSRVFPVEDGLGGLLQDAPGIGGATGRNFGLDAEGFAAFGLCDLLEGTHLVWLYVGFELAG